MLVALPIGNSLNLVEIWNSTVCSRQMAERDTRAFQSIRNDIDQWAELARITPRVDTQPRGCHVVPCFPRLKNGNNDCLQEEKPNKEGNIGYTNFTCKSIFSIFHKPLTPEICDNCLHQGIIKSDM